MKLWLLFLWMACMVAASTLCEKDADEPVDLQTDWEADDEEMTLEEIFSERESLLTHTKDMFESYLVRVRALNPQHELVALLEHDLDLLFNMQENWTTT